MIKRYLVVALRNLGKRKGYALLNLCGLALGLAAALLLFQYVRYERSYDAFHADAGRIYRVRADLYREGEHVLKSASTYPGVGPALQEDFPEVEAFVRITERYGGGVVRYEDRVFREERVYHTDAAFLTFFSYPMRRGDPRTALREPNTAVLSEAAARRYFGEADPVGRRIVFGTDEPYVVTGVVAVHAASHFAFDFLLSYPTLERLWGMDFATAWDALDFKTYVRLRPGVDPDSLERALPGFIARRHAPGANARLAFTLQPLRSIHLHSDLHFELRPNGSAGTLRVLSLLAVLILVLAWVNYVNLTTARALERAREVGVRKLVGARRGQLVGQFLLESLLLNLLAVLLASGLTQLLLPSFAALTGRPLRLDLAGDARLWAVLLGLFGAGTLLSGLYPAFVLSAYRPLAVLKGTFGRGRHGLLLRKGLVVAQFAATVALVAGTFVVAEQVAFMERQALGIDIAQTLVLDAPGTVRGNAAYARRFEAFKQALLRHPRIRSATASSEIPGTQQYWINGALRIGASDARQTSLYVVSVDYDYLGAYAHRLVAGRFLSAAYPADARGVVLNETAVRMLDLGVPASAPGARVRVGGDTLTVVGVVADHHQQGLHQARYQMAFRVVPEEYRYFSVKVAAGAWDEPLGYVERTYRSFFSDAPFAYTFLDQRFDEQYRGYRRFGQIVSLFALLATAVACLGLLGLSVLSTAQRTKEIGIRKVLGARTGGLLALLAGDLLKLVALGGLAAVPVAWYALDRWLSAFAYRTTLHPGPFAAAALATLAVALLSVGIQTLRAARSNPAEALRTE